jgi:hypothetical protein
MKKLTVLALAVFLFAGVANAQLRFGVKGGLTVSSLSTTSSAIDQIKGASSYQGGVLMQLKLGGFAIQPEILYSVNSSDLLDATAKGNAQSQMLERALGKAVTDLNYETQNIVIPLNLQLGMGLGPARVYAQAGPYFSFQLGAALNGDVKLYDTVDETLKFNKYDWGIGLGAGVELLGLQLAAKYDFGMKPIGQETVKSQLSEVNVNPFFNMKNRTLNVSLAYLF